jgi:hypothetical protein
MFKCSDVQKCLIKNDENYTKYDEHKCADEFTVYLFQTLWNSWALCSERSAFLVGGPKCSG